eukprot:gnl/TRDRNA2_/TRDRNA2_194547_c0_seq1.p1 gnl/TRDRNA2_/TRDRNA2_194547_c0~~gnl/TRDRNA2_/TRDRNA2_194547_c0_seq1.p1  ORF type:complete len:447 (+),score=39.61 gnl/TRDRNA2_/TRDRNA2_194547_c0_seq1:145-1485(+)
MPSPDDVRTDDGPPDARRFQLLTNSAILVEEGSSPASGSRSVCRLVVAPKISGRRSLLVPIIGLALSLTVALLCYWYLFTGHDVHSIACQTYPSRMTKSTRRHVHFMFMSMEDVPHAKIWRSFFGGALPDSWSVWLHCKNHSACLHGTFLREVPEAVLVPTVPTAYCTDLVSAEVQLLRYALAEHASKHGLTEKFVLLSHNLLPVKPYREVFHTITSRIESDFCIYPVSTWEAYAQINGQIAHVVQHSQFFALNRCDAEKLVFAWPSLGRDPPDPPQRPVWQVPVVDDKSGFGVAQDVISSEKFILPARHVNCPDENAPFSTVFGAIVYAPRHGDSVDVKGFGKVFHDRRHENVAQGRCFIYFNFGQWSLDNWTLAQDIREAADNESVVKHFHAWWSSHPVTFGDLNARSLSILRESPFLFVRKFTDDARLPDYGKIVFDSSGFEI